MSAFFVAVAGYAVFFSPFLPFATEIAHTAFSPLWNMSSSFAALTDDVRSAFASKERLFAEIRNLERDLRDQKLRLLSADVLKRENELLKRELGRSRAGDRAVLVASVLAKPNRSPYDVLVIDVGFSDGVRKGDRVLYEGVAIGVVSDVFEHTSRAVLFSSPGEETDVVIYPAGITATAKGEGAGTLSIALPRDVDVAKGDSIVLPGISPVVIGKVDSVRMEANDPFRSIFFKGPVNVYTVSFVSVSRNPLSGADAGAEAGVDASAAE